MSWLALVPALGGAIAVLFAPGLIIAAFGGARRMFLWAVAPGVSVGVLAALGTAYPFLGLSWTPLTAALGVLALAVPVGAISWIARRGRNTTAPTETAGRVGGRFFVIAGATAAIVISVQVAVMIGAPDAVSQTFDAAFHLNGVRYLVDHNSASSFELTGLILGPGISSFYPAAWHTVVVSVVQLSGATVPLAANAVNILIAAIVWPAGVLLLVNRLLPTSKAALLAAGVLAAAFPGFPIQPLDYGVLYPYFLALALLPAALAVGLSLVGVVAKRSEPILLNIAVLLALLAGIGLAQPSVALAWGVLMLPPVFARFLRFWKNEPRTPRRVFATTALVVLIGGLAVAWLVAGRIGYSSPWWAYASPLKGLLDLFGLNLHWLTPAVFASALMIIGVVATLRRAGTWWIGASWSIAALLFFLSASMPFWTLRNLLLGPFYKDPPRFFSLLAVVSVPLAAWGAHVVWNWWTAHSERRREAGLNSGPSAKVVAASSLVVLLLGTQLVGMYATIQYSLSGYALREVSPVLSIDERTLIERLGSDGLSDGLIVGNPWTGTAYAYALSGRAVMNPHFNTANGADAYLLNTSLNQANEDPAVCAAVDALDARYVLDFGSYTKDNGDLLKVDSSIGFEGLLDLNDAGVVTELDREGDAVLYEITACG